MIVLIKQTSENETLESSNQKSKTYYCRHFSVADNTEEQITTPIHSTARHWFEEAEHFQLQLPLPPWLIALQQPLTSQTSAQYMEIRRPDEHQMYYRMTKGKKQMLMY